MNLKRIAVFALLLIAATASARAFEPKCNVNYQCHYTNYSGPAVQDGVWIVDLTVAEQMNDGVGHVYQFLKGQGQ